jgi:hypothetical protein
MAGHVRYTALLDACVLFPIAVADSLMSLATAGLFAAKWTQRIELEWITNLEKLRPPLKGRLETRQNGMRDMCRIGRRTKLHGPLSLEI